MIQIQPKAFFFDFDGVIVDSEKVHMMAALQASTKYNINFTENYYFTELLGYDDIGLFEHLWKDHSKPLDQVTLKDLIQDKNHAFLQLIEKHIIFFDGVIQLIQTLHQKNIPLAVVSGALEEEIRVCLKKGDLDSYFKFIVSADMVKHSKPDPESYEKAWENMLEFVPDLEKKDCWVIEDSPAGMSAAIDAGMNVIGITNSVSRDVLSRANYIIEHVREIEILDSL